MVFLQPVAARRGQTALELLFATVLIVSMASLSFMLYANEGNRLAADSVVRSHADAHISQAALDRPQCAAMRLVRIDVNNTLPAYHEYKIRTSIPQCTSLVFTPEARMGIQGKITTALGCIHDEGGRCNGRDYIVCAEDLCG